MIKSVGYSYTYKVESEWKHLYDSMVKQIEEHVFVAIVDDDNEVKLSEEHDKYIWQDYEKALKLLKWSKNIVALRKSYRLLKDT
jgi:hypothetical protein